MDHELSSDTSKYQVDDQEINILEYVNIIRKRIVIILAVFAIIFAWTIIDTYSEIPIYTASSDVLIEKNEGTKNLDFQYFRYDPYFLNTQTEIIKSENVARRVVDILQLEKKYKGYFISAVPDKKSFYLNIKSKIKGAIKAVSPFGSKQETEAVVGGGTSGVFAKEPLSDSDIIAGMVRGGLNVTPVRDTKIVTITYKHKNPFISKLVVDAVVQAYKDITLDIKHSSSSYTIQWMTQKAGEERKKLEDAENALQKYMRDNDLVTVENRLAVIPEKLSDISSEFTKAQTERKQLEEVNLQIDKAAGKESALGAIPLFSTNSVIQDIRERIYRAQQNIKDLSKKYGPKHPVMIKANDELHILNSEKKFEINRITASTKNSYELAKSKEKNLKELFSSTKLELLNINEKFVQLSLMKREVETNRVLYDALTANIKKEGVTKQAQSVNIWVVRKGGLPSSPSHPNKKRALGLGLIIGLVLGVGLAFGLEYLDNTIKSEKDLTNRFDLTVLGTVEQLKGNGDQIESTLIKKTLSPVSESYRLVRSNLLLSSAEHPPKTILITSMGPKEGKTSTTINIARILSQDDKKVLIIDCDLRKPRMHSLFSVDNKVGLSNFLTGTMEGNILLNIPGEDIKIIPSGLIPPNPAELLSSRKMKALVKKMSEMFDFVLIDSPPVQRVTDSLAVSQLVEGTIVVVRARSTTYEMLASGMKKLHVINANVLGFVLNGIRKSDAGSGYYYGYDKYYAKDSES